jgi:hypothetical protein
MTDPTFRRERIVAALNGGDVAYVIVRATGDLDVVPEPSAESLDRLAGALSELDADHPNDEALNGPSLSRPVSFKLVCRRGLRTPTHATASAPRQGD